MIPPPPLGDLVLQYPFPGGDGQDWIANGLALAGEPVRWSGRPPLLPALIALLERLGLLDALPLFLLGAFALQVATSVRLATAGGERRAGRAVRLALLLGLSACCLGLAFEVMADVLAAALAALALRLGVGDERRPAAPVLAGAVAGLAALAQPAGLCAVAGLAAVQLVAGRPRHGTRAHWLGLALALAPGLAFEALRAHALGTAGDVVYRHSTLLGWYPEQLAFYRDALASLLGLPALLLALVGGIELLRSKRILEPRALATGGAALAVLVFFGLFYGFTARRFLVYLLPFLAIALDAGLELVRSRAGRTAAAAAAAIAVAAAALAPGGERAAIAWPLPAFEVEGAPFALARIAAAERLGRHPLAVAWRAAAAREAPGFGPNDFADVRAAVYLHGGEAEAVNYFDRALRLGNAVRRRARALPLASVPGELYRAGAWRPAGGGQGYRLFRFQPPGEPRPWLVGFAAESPLPAPLAGSPPPPLRPRAVRRALDDARCVEAAAARRETPVVLLGDERDLALALVAFTTGSGTLLVVPPADAGRLRDLAGRAEEASGRCAAAGCSPAGCATRGWSTTW